MKTRVMLLKKFTQISITSRFCKSLKTLIDSGIPIVTSLDICSSLIGNEYLKDKNILLIDDITTSGATLEEIINCFLENNINNVFCLTISKT